MDYGDDFDIARHAIDDNVRSSGNSQFPSARNSSHASGSRIRGQELLGTVDQIIRQTIRSDRTLLSYIGLDVIDVAGSRNRPANSHHVARYLFLMRSRSDAAANSPRSAAAMPASILSRKRSCHSSEWPFSSASAITSEAVSRERAAIASIRAWSSCVISNSIVICKLCHGDSFCRNRGSYPQPPYGFAAPRDCRSAEFTLALTKR